MRGDGCGKKRKEFSTYLFWKKTETAFVMLSFFFIPLSLSSAVKELRERSG